MPCWCFEPTVEAVDEGENARGLPSSLSTVCPAPPSPCVGAGADVGGAVVPAEVAAEEGDKVVLTLPLSRLLFLLVLLVAVWFRCEEESTLVAD